MWFKLKRGFLERRLQAWKNGGPFDWAPRRSLLVRCSWKGRPFV